MNEIYFAMYSAHIKELQFYNYDETVEYFILGDFY